jgi:hypothetical protein
MKNLSKLEQLVMKLRLVVMSHHHHTLEPSETTPCIVTGTDDDGEYEGKLMILVGDDTLIRENDEKFYVFDFHNVDADPIWLDEKEVLDFYAGQNEAYSFPNYKNESYHYLRGFSETAKSLLGGIDDFLEDNNNKMKIIK